MPLDLDTREQLLETVRRFVRETCVPIEAKVAEEDRVPDSVIAEMRELGLFGLSIPVEYGGLGLTMEEEVLVAMELGHTSPAFIPILRAGSPAARSLTGTLSAGWRACVLTRAVNSLVRLAGGNGSRSLRASSTAPDATSITIHAFGNAAAVVAGPAVAGLAAAGLAVGLAAAGLGCSQPSGTRNNSARRVAAVRVANERWRSMTRG